MGYSTANVLEANCMNQEKQREEGLLDANIAVEEMRKHSIASKKCHYYWMVEGQTLVGCMVTKINIVRTLGTE